MGVTPTLGGILRPRRAQDSPRRPQDGPRGVEKSPRRFQNPETFPPTPFQFLFGRRFWSIWGASVPRKLRSRLGAVQILYYLLPLFLFSLFFPFPVLSKRKCGPRCFKMAQNACGTAQHGPMMASSWPKKIPKKFQDGPNMAPRWRREGPRAG